MCTGAAWHSNQLLDKYLNLTTQMIVNRMRVRVRLNEARVAEMLRGMDPASLGDSFVSVTAGLLHCIGDVAALTFVPVFAGVRICANPTERTSVQHEIVCRQGCKLDACSRGVHFQTLTLNDLQCAAEDGSKGQYMVCLESSDVSNVCADLQVCVGHCKCTQKTRTSSSTAS